jgi:excisionase family DNA binding protein
MSSPLSSPERKALSVSETARAIGISRATLYRLVLQKRLATAKIGSRTLIPVGEIDALLAKAMTK